MDYSDYAQESSICFDINGIKGETAIDKDKIKTYYELLLVINNSLKMHKIPSHKIFFVTVKDSNSGNFLNNKEFNNFILNKSSEINLNITSQISCDDSSIIAILERLWEYFELIMKAFINFDLNFSPKKIQDLHFLTNQMKFLYKETYNYVMDEKVQFLKNEYNFTKSAFSIIEELLLVIYERVNNLIKFVKNNFSATEMTLSVENSINTMKDLTQFSKDENSENFIKKLINEIDLYEA